MAENQLKIQIVADVRDGVNGVKAFNAELQKAGGAEKNLTSSIAKVNQSFSTLKPGANQAGQAITNLSRVVQDAPFGFIGIANNINPLLESFQRLKVETGTTKGALQALVGSLAGANGIGLAVSVATSLLVVFGDKLFDSGKKAEEAKSKVQTLADIQHDVNRSLAEEQTQVQRNIAVLKSHNTTRDEQVQALKNLKEIDREHFGDLKLEKGLVDNLNIAYGKYIQQLNQRSQARVIEKQLDDINAKIIEQGDKTNLVRAFQDAHLKTLQEIGRQHGENAAIGQQEGVIAKARQDQEKETNKLIAQRDVLLNRLQLTAPNIDIDLDNVKAPKELKVHVEEIKLEPAKVGIIGGQFSKGIDGMADVSQKISTALSAAFLPLKTSATAPAIDGANLKLLEMQETAKKVGAVIQSTLAPAFQQVFETIITDGGNALQAFGQMLKKLVAKIVSAAITAAAFAAILTVISGGTGGAAFLGNFKSIFGQLSGIPMAKGGIVTGPTSILAGEAGDEAIIPLRQLPGILSSMVPTQNAGSNLSVTHTVRGSDLLLVINRTQNQWGSSFR